MFGRKNKAVHIDSLIGAGTAFLGDVSFRGGMRVDGYIRGNVYSDEESSATLVVSELGRIEGDVRVARVIINGEVIGSVFANVTVELMPKARVSGDIHYKNIEMHMGAYVNGALVHEEPSVSGNIVEIKAHQHSS